MLDFLLNFLYPVPYHILARSQGFRSVHDGRIVKLDYRALYDNPMYGYDELFGSTLEMPARGGFIERVADDNTPTHCPTCGAWLEKHRDVHDLWWMAEKYTCHNHPTTVWWDIYPKIEPSQTWDRGNALPHYADRGKKIPISPEAVQRHHFIANEDELRKEDAAQVEEVPLLFEFTPKGLVPIPGAHKAWRSTCRRVQVKAFFDRFRSHFRFVH